MPSRGSFPSRLRAVFGILAVASVALPAWAESGGSIVRLPAQALANGTLVPAHASISGDPSDASAAMRRQEILRSPYLQVSERKNVRGGEIVIGFQNAFPQELQDRFLRTVSSSVASLCDRDGWPRPFSSRMPLQIFVGRQRQEPIAASGWEGRDAEGFVHPVVAINVSERDPEVGIFDAVRQVSLLSVRLIGSDKAGWAVEGMAEWLTRRLLGYQGEPSPENDALLEETGALSSPLAFAEYLELLERHLPHGAADVRAAWEEAGANRSEDAELFLRTLSQRVDPRGLAGFLADSITRKLSSPSADRWIASSAADWRTLQPGELDAGAPGPLGWRRVALRTSEERGGLEIGVPDGTGCSSARAVLFYRGNRSEFDALELVPGIPKTVPLSGTARVHLLLVDGAEPGELFVRLERVPDYPAALVTFAAEWRDDAVQLTWRTSSHRDLLAWVVVRSEEIDDQVVELGRELVPTADFSKGGFAYHVRDGEALVGHRYRYRILALTLDGMLSEAFETFLVPRR
jgi:hypothetical protein